MNHQRGQLSAPALMALVRGDSPIATQHFLADTSYYLDTAPLSGIKFPYLRKFGLKGVGG